VVEGVLLIAVIILFVLVLPGKGGSTSTASTAGDDSDVVGKTLPIAYVDVDSLLQNYNYAIDLNEQMSKKYENSRANMTEKLRRLQAEGAEFQRKYETNAFLSRERAEAEQQRLLKKQEELQKLEAELTKELADEQTRMNEDLRQTIITQLRQYNKDKHYHIIYGKINENIIYAENAYNITAEVIDYLNRQHAVSPLARPAN
jgi:outer membrane protein